MEVLQVDTEQEGLSRATWRAGSKSPASTWHVAALSLRTALTFLRVGEEPLSVQRMKIIISKRWAAGVIGAKPPRSRSPGRGPYDGLVDLYDVGHSTTRVMRHNRFISKLPNALKQAPKTANLDMADATIIKNGGQKANSWQRNIEHAVLLPFCINTSKAYVRDDSLIRHMKGCIKKEIKKHADDRQISLSGSGQYCSRRKFRDDTP
ncbi:hypothetical protein JB92DRAFT_2838869 [Gautieria morchelliformis]|nr:hypothetical protein JB92DRAFT_2838869 [Gautieria morchelliformis]